MQNVMQYAMQNAMWLASIFGPFLMIMGLWMLFYHDNMMKVIGAVKNNAAIFYLMSIGNLLVGLVVLSEFNEWVWGLSLLVTIFGWFIFIRGLLALFVPHLLVKIALTDPGWIRVKGIVPLAWGFGLCWFAFWMV